MRPPMQTAALQQNEEGRQHQQQHQQQQLYQQKVQQQQQQEALAAEECSSTNNFGNQQTQSISRTKFTQRQSPVANHLSLGKEIPTPKARLSTQQTYLQQQQNRQHRFVRHHSIEQSQDDFENIDDSIQLVDLSTSPPEPLQYTPLPLYTQQQQKQQQKQQEQHKLETVRRVSVNRSSVISQYSHSSSSDDGSLSGEKSQNYSRANTFDDAAEHFIINFPADSDSPLHNQNDCIINLPLSETEPLLTDIESTQRAIYVHKNSASLIFTKKDAVPVQHQAIPTGYYLPVTRTNNNCPNNQKPEPRVIPLFATQRRRHNSLKGTINENSLLCGNIEGNTTNKKTKHLPATYHQQQRRSLQLNYNNNLVTTSTCTANNNYCCASTIPSNGSTISESGGAAVLHKHHSGQTAGITASVTTAATATTATATRKQHAYSWYAPVYSALEEELEQDSRDSSPIHNLANTKRQHSNHYHHRARRNTTSSTTDNEAVALLESRNQINIQAQLHGEKDGDQQQQLKNRTHINAPNSLLLQNSHNVPSFSVGGGSGGGGGGGVGSGEGSLSNFSSGTTLNSYDVEGPHAGSLGLAGGPLPRRRRFENFIKSLVGLKSSSTSGRNSIGSSNSSNEPTMPNAKSQLRIPASPEITITRTPSEQEVVVMRDPAGRAYQQQQQHHHLKSSEKLPSNGINGSTSSLNVVQQKLWKMMRREGSAASLHQEKSQSIVQYTGMRKCETVLALTRQANSLCSPVLSTGSSCIGSATRLHHTGSGIFNANGVEQIRPMNRLRNSAISINATCSRCSSLLSLAASGSRYSLNVAASNGPGGYMHTLPTSASQHQLLAPQLSTRFEPQRGRRSSIVSINSVNCSNSHRRDDIMEEVDGNNGTQVFVTQSNCFRKSSAGANSTHSNSSISPPSNMTTATLNSSITPSSSITPTSPITMPPTATASIMHFKSSVTGTAISLSDATAPRSPTTATSTTLAPGYPLTVTSLLSTSHKQTEGERDLTDGSIGGISNSPTTLALKPPIKPNHHQQHQQQQQQQQQQIQQIQMSTSAGATVTPAAAAVIAKRPFQTFTCKLCLIDVESEEEATTLQQCGCQFCTECMKAYVEFEISEGAYDISCPDACCPAQGVVTLPEIASLTTANLMKKHHRYRLNREIELDKSRTWCPRAGCETVCHVCPAPHSDDGEAVPSSSTSATHSVTLAALTSPTAADGITPLICAVQCPSCKDEFCSACKKTWHPNLTCEEHSRRLVADGQDDIGIPFDNDLIKCCPMCAVPIEKDEGCAQMMCKRCKHVFCWYCLASLDDDFLLRHYDKGPCKNKLGHSRASVVWHRAQVIGIFAGFGILLLVASPLLLLAAPCIICCKCRSCSGSKIDEGEGDMDEAAALQS